MCMWVGVSLMQGSEMTHNICTAHTVYMCLSIKTFLNVLCFIVYTGRLAGVHGN